MTNLTQLTLTAAALALGFACATPAQAADNATTACSTPAVQTAAQTLISRHGVLGETAEYQLTADWSTVGGRSDIPGIYDCMVDVAGETYNNQLVHVTATFSYTVTMMGPRFTMNETAFDNLAFRPYTIELVEPHLSLKCLLWSFSNLGARAQPAACKDIPPVFASVYPNTSTMQIQTMCWVRVLQPFALVPGDINEAAHKALNSCVVFHSG